ncbi:MAG TPA: hypothetical protein VIE39_02870 [Thermoanaerobaculia bacterium]|jgi:hypothetical protein
MISIEKHKARSARSRFVSLRTRLTPVAVTAALAIAALGAWARPIGLHW